MPAPRDVRSNFNIFVDGKGFAGQSQDFTPPELALKMEEIRAGGMDMPVELDMGQEAMSMSFTLLAHDATALKTWGVGNGANTQFTVREVLKSSDGGIRSSQHYFRGLTKTLAQAQAQAGAVAGTAYTVACKYYKHVVNGETVIEIDSENMVRIIGGVDVLAAQRQALGM